MTPSAKYLIDLVRQLDAAQRERLEIVVPLDAKIASLEAEIEAIAAGRSSSSSDDEEDEDEDAVAAPLSHAQHVLHMIRQTGQVDQNALAMRFYGESTGITRKRIRSVLHYLKNAEKIRRKGDGWEAIG